MSGPRFLTVDELAELLRTSPETVRYWRHVSKGPKSFKVGRRVLYAVEDVEAFIAEGQDSPRDPVPDLPHPNYEPPAVPSFLPLPEQIAQAIEAAAKFEGVRAQRIIRMCAYIARNYQP